MKKIVLVDLAVIAVLSVFAWAALLSPDYFLNAHDAPHSIFFLVEFDQNIKDGTLIPRWGTDHAWGYGYPTFIFYSPLAYYVAEAFHLLGASPTVAVKITYVLAFILSGWAMYAFVRRLFGREAGLVAAVVYIYVPYHLVDLYVRCALSEFCAFVFLPLCLWSFLEVVESRHGFPSRISRTGLRSHAPMKPAERTEDAEQAFTAVPDAWDNMAHSVTSVTKIRVGWFHNSARHLQASPWRWLIWAALSYAGLILTHNATCFLFTPWLGAYIIFLLLRQMVTSKRRWRPTLARTGYALGYIAGALALALALSAFFLLPMFAELKYIPVGQWTRATYSYEENFVYPSQLFSPFWDWGFSVEGIEDTMPFQLGLMAVTLTIAALCRRRVGAYFLFFLVVTLIVVWIMLPFSLPVWKVLPIAALVQFPWRLLALTAVTLSILAGAVAARGESGIGNRELGVGSQEGGERREENLLSPTSLYVLLVVVALASAGYARPEYTPPSPRSETPLGVLDFELAHPDMVGMTVWSRELPTSSPLVDQYLNAEPLLKAHILRGEGTVEMVRHGGASEEVITRASQEVAVQFYTYYYPGWRGYVDGEEVHIWPEGKLGLITLDAPGGEHRVQIRFGDIPVRVVGKAISALGILVAVFPLAWSLKRKRPEAGGGCPLTHL